MGDFKAEPAFRVPRFDNKPVVGRDPGDEDAVAGQRSGADSDVPAILAAPGIASTARSWATPRSRAVSRRSFSNPRAGPNSILTCRRRST